MPREMKSRFALIHAMPYTNLIKVVLGNGTSNFFECFENLDDVILNWSELTNKQILNYIKGARFLESDLPGIKLGMELTNSKLIAHKEAFEGDASSILTTGDIHVLEFSGKERDYKGCKLLSEF